MVASAETAHDAPRRDPREATPVRRPGDRPQPDRKHRHLGPSGKRHGPGERREHDASEEEDEKRDASPERLIGPPGERQRDSEKEREPRSERHECAGERRSERIWDPAGSSERGQQSGDELGGRPCIQATAARGCRSTTGTQNRKRSDPARAASAERSLLSAAAHGDRGAHREEREVVRVEERGREKSQADQPGRSLPDLRREQEEEEDQGTDSSAYCSPGLGGVEDEKRRERSEEDEPQLRPARRKEQRAGEYRNRRGEGQSRAGRSEEKKRSPARTNGFSRR